MASLSAAEIGETTTENAVIRTDILDTKEDADFDKEWTIVSSLESAPAYMYYYANESNFQKHLNHNNSCPFVLAEYFNITELPEFTGTWAACMDKDLSENCTDLPSTPCHPFIR